MTRCQSCHKPVSPSRETCPWCEGPTGLPRHRAFPAIDERLNALRLFGAPMALWGGFVACLTCEGHLNPLVPITGLTFAVVMLVAHLLLPMSSTAWNVAEWGWLLAAVAGVDLVVTTGGLWAAAIVPAVAWVAMRVYRRTALARLAGEAPESWEPPKATTPSPGPCRVCGDEDAAFVARRYCMSFFVVTWRFSGAYRTLCKKHAIRSAVPATVVSAVFGVWGIPMGPIRTAQVINQNMTHGGAVLTAANVQAIRKARERDDGRREYTVASGLVLGLMLCPALILVPAIPYLERLV